MERTRPGHGAGGSAARARPASGGSAAGALAIVLSVGCEGRSGTIVPVAEEQVRAPAAASAGAAAARSDADPARIDGTWSYETESNCGKVPGVGEVSFTWNASTGVYDEKGSVYWADSRSTIRWWGPATHDGGRRLDARVKNTLGDTVDGAWELEGSGPDRLVTRWEQTNGCRGVGVATRGLPGARKRPP